MKSIRTLSAVMLLLMIFISCSNNTPQSDNTVTTTADSGAEDTDGGEADTLYKPDNLPANLNFNGETITILYRAEDDPVEFFVPEQTGDIVEDAVYTANRNVEERLNVNLNVITRAGFVSADRGPFVNHVQNSVLAGDNEFQLLAALTASITTITSNGNLLDLMKLPYLDFDQPWWADGLKEQTTIGDKLYFAAGDASLSLLKTTMCLYFNIKLAEDFNIGNMYELIYDNKWTIDKASELSALISADINGDGVMTTDTDRYGFILYDFNHFNAYIPSFDLSVTESNDDGGYNLVFGNEKVTSAVERLCSFFHTEPGNTFAKTQNAADQEILRNAFTTGRSLIISAEFNHAEIYRDMENDFGIIPFPMWDESQSDYQTFARNVFNSFGVPITCVNTDLAACVLEAIASENYRTLTSTYYNTALKTKYAREEEAVRMYDIIRSSIRFNFAYTFNADLNMIVTKFRDNIQNNNVNWASTYAGQEVAAVGAMEKYIEAIMELE